MSLCINRTTSLDMNDNHSAETSDAAYRIWEEEGKPEGKALDHWQRAEMAEIHKTVSENMPSTPQKPSPEDYG